MGQKPRPKLCLRGGNQQRSQREGYCSIKQVNLKKGFAFCVFDDDRDAEDAVKDLNGTRLRGERVKLEFAKGERRGSDRERYEAGSGYRVVVENISSKTAWQDLKDY